MPVPLLIIAPSGDVSVKKCAGLEDIQKAVGGYLEFVIGTEGERDEEGNSRCDCFVNEEGFVRNLPLNIVGTKVIPLLFPDTPPELNLFGPVAFRCRDEDVVMEILNALADLASKSN